MPFCTSCGKEALPGKKFCEFCGAPLELPAPPAVPDVPSASTPPATASPAGVPEKPGRGSGKTLLLAGVVVVLVLLVCAIALPMFGGPKTAGAVIPATTAPAQVLLSTQTTVQPVITPDARNTGSPGTMQTYEDRYRESYSQVYSINQPFAGGQKMIFNQDLTKPPLYIKFAITPVIHTEEKRVDIGMPSEHIVNATYTSPDAWFKVRIYDAGNNALVEEQGFNKEFSITAEQEFMVRAPGNYRVEMSGNDVTAEVRILTGT